MKFTYPLIHGRLVRWLARELTQRPVRNGVELIVVQARITPESIDFHRVLPVEL